MVVDVVSGVVVVDVVVDVKVDVVDVDVVEVVVDVMVLVVVVVTARNVENTCKLKLFCFRFVIISINEV